MVLAQKQTYNLKKQKSKTQTWVYITSSSTQYLTKIPKTCTGEKKTSSTNDTGQTGNPDAKEWNETCIYYVAQNPPPNGSET